MKWNVEVYAEKWNPLYTAKFDYRHEAEAYAEQMIRRLPGYLVDVFKA